jgi:predicted peroxiredoxin
MNRTTTLRFGLLLAALLGTYFAGALLQPDRPLLAAATAKAPILLNITSGPDSLHAVSMGLGLAGTALDHGHAVTVFLNVHAPAFAAKNADATLKYADFPPVTEMLAAIQKKGGKILVCKHCAMVCGVGDAGILDGAQYAEHGAILDSLLPGTVSLSY